MDGVPIAGWGWDCPWGSDVQRPSYLWNGAGSAEREGARYCTGGGGSGVWVCLGEGTMHKENWTSLLPPPPLSTPLSPPPLARPPSPLLLSSPPLLPLPPPPLSPPDLLHFLLSSFHLLHFFLFLLLHFLLLISSTFSSWPPPLSPPDLLLSQSLLERMAVEVEKNMRLSSELQEGHSGKEVRSLQQAL